MAFATSSSVSAAIQVAQPGVRQDADPLSGQEAVTSQGQDRDAHPQGFHARRHAVVGKGVEADVDQSVGGEVTASIADRISRIRRSAPMPCAA